MGLLGRIAAGISTDLITRAADVILKERRRLILVLRDTPYSLIHISNMKTVTEAGGIICPATPSFYSKPKTFEDLAATVVDRVLDLAGFDLESFRWGEDQEDGKNRAIVRAAADVQTGCIPRRTPCRTSFADGD